MSEVLEKLEQLCVDMFLHAETLNDDELNEFESYVSVKKELEILSILKEKKVMIGWLTSPNCQTLDDYNFDLGENTTEKPLTQEEFDKLKEWL